MKRKKPAQINSDERTPAILTNDPSITAWGWAVISMQGEILETGCIKTQPSAKALRIRKGDDRTRRITEINAALLSIFDKYKINVILSELPHGSQSASAAIMIGITTGIMQTISDVLQIPLEWYSEGDAKKMVAGKRSVPKGEMIKIISELYPEMKWTGTKWRDEGIADAMAVYRVATVHNKSLKQ